MVCVPHAGWPEIVWHSATERDENVVDLLYVNVSERQASDVVVEFQPSEIAITLLWRGKPGDILDVAWLESARCRLPEAIRGRRIIDRRRGGLVLETDTRTLAHPRFSREPTVVPVRVHLWAPRHGSGDGLAGLT